MILIREASVQNTALQSHEMRQRCYSSDAVGERRSNRSAEELMNKTERIFRIEQIIASRQVVTFKANREDRSGIDELPFVAFHLEFSVFRCSIGCIFQPSRLMG